MAKNFTWNVIYFGMPLPDRLGAAGALQGSVSEVLISTASVARTQLVCTHKSYIDILRRVKRYQTLKKNVCTLLAYKGEGV